MAAISNTSGLAGIALWINNYYSLSADRQVTKNDSLVAAVKDWVDQQYADGRVTVMTDEELQAEIDMLCKESGRELGR